jgi:hypothetical protein
MLQSLMGIANSCYLCTEYNFENKGSPTASTQNSATEIYLISTSLFQLASQLTQLK